MAWSADLWIKGDVIEILTIYSERHVVCPKCIWVDIKLLFLLLLSLLLIIKIFYWCNC